VIVEDTAGQSSDVLRHGMNEKTISGVRVSPGSAEKLGEVDLITLQQNQPRLCKKNSWS